MGLHPSGAVNEEVELIEIETAECSLYIKGKPYHHRYESLKQYKKVRGTEQMHFSYNGKHIESVRVFDVQSEQMTEVVQVPPLFFENGTYQVVVTPKNGSRLHFYHEHPSFRYAVSRVGKPPHELLMGNLTFTNEVGYSTFQIGNDQEEVLSLTIEVFPSKLSYKEDYKRLLEEVNEEVYNLAYHFVKKTYMAASTSLTVEPSWSEFYRLLSEYYEQFMRAITQIERQPHHQMLREHRLVRGDQLKKQDARGRKFLRKRPHLFVETKKGIEVRGTSRMPIKGLNVEKRLSYDTLENRFVKWMMERIIHKMESLQSVLRRSYYEVQSLTEKDQEIERMKRNLETKLQSAFWRPISRLDRSVMSLVLQMAPGYREAYQAYLTLSRGLVLQGQLSRMSVKDVATLYEYWTFLKLGQILATKYPMVSQDVIKVNRQGLFVTLDQSATAKRVFRHPETQEKITLFFQKHSGNVPTVKQKPDSMLSIEKAGKERTYEYVFDAKYRVDFAVEGGYYNRTYKSPGPLEEDINTMHRYRDALVEGRNATYERYAFGAYVLFPWGEEHAYERHQFYQSIRQVNIGGFPFLPNSTSLVERFLDRLIERSPEQLQAEGILPKGTLEEWESTFVEKVLILNVSTEDELRNVLRQGFVPFPPDQVTKSWNEAAYVALYHPKQEFGEKGGIHRYARIERVSSESSEVKLYVDAWKMTDHLIQPVGYGIGFSAMTTLDLLREAEELPQLFMKSSVEQQMWKLLRRFSKNIEISLDQRDVGLASGVTSMRSDDGRLMFELKGNNVVIVAGEDNVVLEREEFAKRPNVMFGRLMELL
ncbi:restriction endonuclease-like protein [Halobacillus salinus]|uniref:DUF2357 domain-containing protein n=1 Tax=Halobacillus salinus TaxID=192814 RepID=A0A4Z0GZ76_9BACI|nr:restriction endonuclease-like protein [Halobacillus salinus]TGB03513.1 DUF2357 domain-containing protein [Halobacillus salinus]